MTTLLERFYGLDHDARVFCERDAWEFSPRYTNGVCPLCGWRPPTSSEPESAWIDRVDWFLVSLVALVLSSILMGVLVAITY